MTNISKDRLNEIISNFKGKKIAVIGDLMLDRYFWGKVTRVSPEAPVPVVDLQSESYHLGGAANVSANLVSLGLEVIQCGLIGDDEAGQKLQKLSEGLGIDITGTYVDSTRPTTVKTRVFGNNQQIVRLDTETTEIVNNSGERFILDVLHKTENIAGVVFGDYNKGSITDIMIREVIHECNTRNIPIFVDPKFENFYSYSDVTLFKPNKKEAENALNMKMNNLDNIKKGAKKLIKQLNCKNVLITLGSEGMLLAESNGEISTVPTKARYISDVSGAGDTAISCFAAATVGGASPQESALIANIGAGIVCEKPGIVSITNEELINEL